MPSCLVKLDKKRYYYWFQLLKLPMGIPTRRAFLLRNSHGLIMVLIAFFCEAQVTCPATTACGPCEGPVTTITLQYNGTSSAQIKVEDNTSVIFSESVAPMGSILLVPSGQNFKGNTLKVSVDDVLNATINTKCNIPLYLNAVYGDFTIVAGESKTGGPFCCAPEPGEIPTGETPEEFLEISAVVTPNGDGTNDIWILRNVEVFSESRVTIVDRWGNLIFSASGYDNQSVAWDGKNQSGGNVPTGTYFYHFSGQSGSSRVNKRGSLELIR
jgi:gliding motility-associated-like protein